eukprot:CAMPEP_0114996678 /NCGR_PEP_ID=MMETSP0216-20121206/14459_1 /TAXON_ID=223996 /ORGANISM="Protocruzia adherens, Strain Boccale" /LENGTH=501 /DNA_ID=CAMNT_0002360939 /DNA_START=58 /DNA_END=1563 /DNA_ORIENTATION=+
MESPLRNSVLYDKYSSSEEKFRAIVEVEKSPQFIQKMDRMRREFAEIDTDRNGMIDRDELIAHLKKRGQERVGDNQVDIKEYNTKDEEVDFYFKVVDRIFKLVDRDRNGLISMDEFVVFYLETEEEYNKEIGQLNKVLVDLRRKRDEFSDKVQGVRTSIGGEKSTVVVNVFEARDLLPKDTNGFSDPYTVVTFGSQQQKTRFISGTLNPIWEENFVFEVEPHQDMTLQMDIFDYDQWAKDDFEGRALFDVTSLEDQKQHDMWLRLTEKDDPETATHGTIKLGIQWVRNKRAYYEELLGEREEEIAEVQALIDDYKEKIKKLDEPFGFLESKESSWLAPREKMKQLESDFAFQFENIAKGTLRTSEIDWVPVTLAIFRIYMLLAVLECLLRPSLLNVCVASSLVMYLVQGPDSHSKHTYYFHLGAAIAAFFSDLIWIIQNERGWLFGQTNAWDGGVQETVKSLAALITLINFFYKIIVIAVLWRHSINVFTFEFERKQKLDA